MLLKSSPRKDDLWREQIEEVWADQLKDYITADTVYALLLDPTTIVVMHPDGSIRGEPVDLTALSADDLVEELSFLSSENSISARALAQFVEGLSPTGYIDVETDSGREALHRALRVSAEELRSYAETRVQESFEQYEEYQKQEAALKTVAPLETIRHTERFQELFETYGRAVQLREKIIPVFLLQTGRKVPTSKRKADRFIKKVYSTEAANLVLARIMFVRFLEDYKMVTRKISNGGIQAFGQLFKCIKDNYRFLLHASFEDAKAVYARIFEESIFDWVAEGDGVLSEILLRIFYRLNAFDFTKLTGDILGNVYERFLDPKSRKELGEFYTPTFVVDHILQCIGFDKEPNHILDPACGSGTFLFRAMEMAIDEFRSRGVDYPTSIELAVELLHGLDINVFSAFIAQLQLIWHLLGHIKNAGVDTLPEFSIGGGIDSLDTEVQTTLAEHLVSSRESKARVIRAKQYDYLVGNPPYIRAEVSKSGELWKQAYAPVATGKTDTAFYFLYRGLEETEDKTPPWLKVGGKMGWVVSMGIADSSAAQSLRDVLINHEIIEIADLESLSNEVFTSGMASRGTVAPIILVVKRKEIRTSTPNYNLRVRVVTRDKSLAEGQVSIQESPPSSLPAKTFTDDSFNPKLRYLTKIRREDIPILRKLFASRLNIEKIAKPVPGSSKTAIQVGIQTGRGGGKIFSERKKGTFPMLKGAHIHAFILNEPAINEHVLLEKAENQSLWRFPKLLGETSYCINEIGYAPQCAKFDSSEYVAQKSAIVLIPSEDYEGVPWDVYLNSSLCRFIFGITGRSALIEGNEHIWRSTINTSTLEAMPVSKGILSNEKELAGMAQVLREEAETILHSSSRIDDMISKAEKTRLALLDVEFHGTNVARNLKRYETRMEEAGDRLRLRSYVYGNATKHYLEGDRDVIEFLDYLLSNPNFRFTPRPKAKVPEDVTKIAAAIRHLRSGKDRSKFEEYLERADNLLCSTLGLNKKETEYVIKRVGSPPFDQMMPRWPWIPAVVRPTRIYKAERYT